MHVFAGSTTDRCAHNCREETASVAEASKTREGRTSALGRSPDDLQVPCQTEEDSASDVTPKGVR